MPRYSATPLTEHLVAASHAGIKFKSGHFAALLMIYAEFLQRTHSNMQIMLLAYLISLLRPYLEAKMSHPHTPPIIGLC